MAKQKKAGKDSIRHAHGDQSYSASDTFGFRGADATFIMRSCLYDGVGDC